MAWPSALARTKNWGTETLTDSDLEGQFDLIIDYINDALNSSSGHKHDGTTSEGPKILTANIDDAAGSQGDVFYSSGTAITRLAAGTNGQYLQTQGAAANPQWATVTDNVGTDEYTDASDSVTNSTGNQTTTSTSYVDTDLSITFTPSVAGLCFVSFSGYASSASGVGFVAINVGSTQVAETGVPSGSSTNVSMSWQGDLAASSQTVKIQLKSSGSALTLLGGTVTSRLLVSHVT